jgi:hypothetical protein
MRPLKPSELKYRGRKVNPETFAVKKPDLRRLVGRCYCGVILRGEAALPQADPFASDVHHDNTPVVQCDDCRAESAAGI